MLLFLLRPSLSNGVLCFQICLAANGRPDCLREGHLARKNTGRDNSEVTVAHVSVLDYKTRNQREDREEVVHKVKVAVDVVVSKAEAIHGETLGEIDLLGLYERDLTPEAVDGEDREHVRGWEVLEDQGEDLVGQLRSLV